MYDLLNDENPLETIKNNIPEYIKRLIIAGDKNSTIKAKVIGFFMALGLSVSDPNELESEIELIRNNLKIDDDMEFK